MPVRLPDPNPAVPPDLPETPLYPRLRTNTPVPSMTYPGFPFPPNTALYPTHEHIEDYHRAYATHYDLYSRIRLNHTVVASNWVGNSAAGYWNITISDHDNNLQQRSFDHLVVASGNNHFPSIPTWRGQDGWLLNNSSGVSKREIVHSLWYRSPKKYIDKVVLVVGSGASGRDAASQVSEYARAVGVLMHHLSECLIFYSVLDLQFG